MHAEVLEHYRADKVIVFKMKAKKHYRKKTVRALLAAQRRSATGSRTSEMVEPVLLDD